MVKSYLHTTIKGVVFLLQGKLINLRMIKQLDLDEILSLSSDLSQRGEYYNINLTSESVYKKRYQETGFWNDDTGTMVITDKDGRLVGDIAYFKGVWYLPGYEIGYRIFKEEDRGKGYITEALKLFSAYLFAVKPINRLEIQVAKGNIPSRKVAEKCGFVYEGLKRQAVYLRGRYEDIELLSLLKEECPGLGEVAGK